MHDRDVNDVLYKATNDTNAHQRRKIVKCVNEYIIHSRMRHNIENIGGLKALTTRFVLISIHDARFHGDNAHANVKTNVFRLILRRTCDGESY